MIVLICGGRDYNGDGSCLDMLPELPSIIIHGNARGADAVGKNWAISRVYIMQQSMRYGISTVSQLALNETQQCYSCDLIIVWHFRVAGVRQ